MFARRLGQVVGIGILSLVLLESLLQVGALLVRTTGRTLSVNAAIGDLRVLCLGDSNTFGIYLPEEESYPSQLEKRGNEIRSSRIDVVNLGYPGTNSSRVLANYRKAVETFRPDVVLLMVGVNDAWTKSIEAATEEGGRGSIWSFFAAHSRLYRVYLIYETGRYDPAKLTVAKSTFDPRSSRHREEVVAAGGLPDWLEKNSLSMEDLEIDDAIAYGDTRFSVGWQAKQGGTPGKETMRTISSNLAEIFALANQSQIALFAMTYPSADGFYCFTNDVIRATARSEEIPLIDLEKAFTVRCRGKQPCRDLFFEDHHPTGEGYAVIAEVVADEVHARIDSSDSSDGH